MRELETTYTPTGMKVTYGSDNIFADLGFDEDEAANLLVRSRLMSRLIDLIDENGWTQQEAAEHLGVHQPRISALMRGKVGEFSLDALVVMLSKAGLHLRIEFDRAA